MNSIVRDKAREVAEICRRRQVLRLSVFGSVTSSSFDRASSDLDFVVEFYHLTPAAHADSYFGLQDDLERLFGCPVDLVEPGPIRNPYFRQAVEQTQVLVYAAP
ncbi:MAG TPA: nucleotidyltransferase domain-containing protein [Terriglobia bacterium]|nr:nucleotidyltransferase domain-containing protein [Terriglobia bacterium]